jgi:hypothetical protein
MAVKNATDEQKVAFGEALMSALMGKGLRPPDLLPVTNAANREAAGRVANSWINGKTEPSRPTVTAIESLLDLDPGTLSRHLGWLPVGAPEIPDPEAAVIAYPHYTGEQRRVLLALMKSFRNQ